MGSSRGASSNSPFRGAPVDHRQPIGTSNVPSVIHALRSVGKTTTKGVVVFFIGTTYITLGVVYDP